MPAQCVQLVADPRERGGGGGEGLGGLCLLLFGFFFFFFLQKRSLLAKNSIYHIPSGLFDGGSACNWRGGGAESAGGL